MQQYILAHDLGTSGNKATLFSLDGKLGASTVVSYPTYYPADGFVEQNPEDWWKAVCESTRHLLQKATISASQIAAVCFSGQMMGCLLVDKNGTPLRNMITWADTRSGKQADKMESLLGMKEMYQLTGNRIGAAYMASKLLWVRDNEPEIYSRAAQVLQAKDYIIYKLTGQFVTDYSDATGSNLFDIHTRQYAKDVLDTLNIDYSLLPELRASTDIAGLITSSAASATGLIQGTPVVIGGGDGACACVGAGVVQPGSAYATLGSSAWVALASKAPVLDPKMRVYTLGHLDKDLCMPVGAMSAAGLSYNWYRETLCQPEAQTATEHEKSIYDIIDQTILDTTPGADGVLFLPYLMGERSPLWDINARGAFLGLSATTKKGNLSRAVLEGIGFNLKIILDALERSENISHFTITGGGAKGAVWLQILADMWQKTLHVPVYIEEATSLGAAVCGGVGIGAFKSFDVVTQFNSTLRTVEPNAAITPQYQALYAIFKDVYAGLQAPYQQLADYRNAFSS